MFFFLKKVKLLLSQKDLLFSFSFYEIKILKRVLCNKYIKIINIRELYARYKICTLFKILNWIELDLKDYIIQI